MNRTVLIFLGILSVIVLVIFSFFEIKTVPDVDLKRHYYYDSKDPYGSWVLYSLLEERYGQENVLKNHIDMHISDIDSSEAKTLYLAFGSNLTYDNSETEDIVDFLNKGNDLFFITSSLKFDYDWGIGRPYRLNYFDSVVNILYSEMDTSTYSFYPLDAALVEGEIMPFSYLEYEEIGLTEIDSIYDDTDEIDDTLEDQDHSYGVGYVDSSYVVYKEWRFDEGYVNVHSMPELFANVSARQEFFLDHFNLLIGQFEYDQIIFDHPSFNRNRERIAESPLQFLLGNRSLRWAYYVMLLTSILYVAFRARRRQKVIPTIEANKNTSLEYIRTLGDLYEHQHKPKKLVKHMEQIFYHFVKGKYGLDNKNENFAERLSKKSQFKVTDIELLMRAMGQVNDRYNFSNQHLTELYQRLDYFYNNCK